MSEDYAGGCNEVTNMISIPFLVCVIGLILWIILSAPSPAHWIKPIVAEASKWCFIIGLFWTLSVYAGKVVFNGLLGQ